MTVAELFELLKEHDPDAQVLIVTQRSWPFECGLRGVTSRGEVMGDEDDEEALPPGASRTDVLLVEGSQVRYGSKRCWEVVP